MNLFPVQWDMNSNNGENWWQQEPLISYLPARKNLHLGFGQVSTDAPGLVSLVLFVKDMQAKSYW